MTAEQIEGDESLLVPEIRCATCTSPHRELFESLLTAGYPLARIREYLLSRGLECPTANALGVHKKRHMIGPGDPQGIVTMALNQGGRQLQRGKIKMNAASLAQFVKLQRDMKRDGDARASEELLARGINHMLTVLRSYLSQDQFHAFREEVWPGLTELVDGGGDSIAPQGADPQAAATTGAAPGVPEDGFRSASSPGAAQQAPEGGDRMARSGDDTPAAAADQPFAGAGNSAAGVPAAPHLQPWQGGSDSAAGASPPEPGKGDDRSAPSPQDRPWLISHAPR